ncbi:MAG: response regulator, partial [Betaproteobacteria bacterium]|nr:response regulator [Betaproteobacteria bacterium]
EHCRRWGFETVVALPNEVADVLRAGPRFDILLTDFVEPAPEVEQLRRAQLQDDAKRQANNELLTISILLSSINRAELSRRGLVPLLRHDMFLIRPVGQARMMDVLMRAVLRETNRDIATRPFTPEPHYDNDFIAHVANHQRDGLLAASRAATSAEVLLGVINDHHPLNILIAEDNEINQRVTQGMLNNLGHHATVVDNGRAAVDAALGGRFDLIFMDIQMPELDGLGAMREIRKRWPSDGPPCPPIVALTAHALADDRENYLSAGMDDYLAKPIRAADLKNLLGRWSAEHQGDTSENEAATPPQQDLPSTGQLGNTAYTSPAVLSVELLPVLDIEQLEDLRYLPAAPGSDLSAENTVGSLLNLFQTKGRERIDGMALKLAEADWAALAEIAHSLRGSAANMGFPRVAALCKSMELDAKRLVKSQDQGGVSADAEPLPTAADLQEIFGQIRLRYHEADSALAQWISSTPNQPG